MYYLLDVTGVFLCFRHLKDVILLTAIVQVLSVISSYFWYLWLLVRTFAGDKNPALQQCWVIWPKTKSSDLWIFLKHCSFECFLKLVHFCTISVKSAMASGVPFGVNVHSITALETFLWAKWQALTPVSQKAMFSFFVFLLPP